jgi:hypothetical protein
MVYTEWGAKGNNSNGKGLNLQLSHYVRYPIKLKGKVFSIICHEGSGRN